MARNDGMHEKIASQLQDFYWRIIIQVAHNDGLFKACIDGLKLIYYRKSTTSTPGNFFLSKENTSSLKTELGVNLVIE